MYLLTIALLWVEMEGITSLSLLQGMRVVAVAVALVEMGVLLLQLEVPVELEEAVLAEMEGMSPFRQIAHSVVVEVVVVG
jgi:hypothetical protein